VLFKQFRGGPGALRDAPLHWGCFQFAERKQQQQANQGKRKKKVSMGMQIKAASSGLFATDARRQK
jgi:hypothetical protein